MPKKTEQTLPEQASEVIAKLEDAAVKLETVAAMHRKAIRRLKRLPWPVSEPPKP